MGGGTARDLRDFRTSANGYATNFLEDRWGGLRWAVHLRVAAEIRRFPRPESGPPDASRDKCNRQEGACRESRSARTARMRSGRSPIETAMMVPSTRAIMVASVSAAAPATAATAASVFTITRNSRCGRSLSRHSMARIQDTVRLGRCPYNCNNTAQNVRQRLADRQIETALMDTGPVVGHEDRIAGV